MMRGSQFATFIRHYPMPKIFCGEFSTIRTPQQEGDVVGVSLSDAEPPAATYVPEIRKYQRKFNNEILCGSLWGVNLLIG